MRKSWMTFSFDETYINRWPFEMPNARRDAAVIVSCLWSLFLWNLPVKPTSGAEPRAPTGIEEKPITRENRYHWSFQPLHRPNIPTVRDIDWPITPVDHFILTRLEQIEADRESDHRCQQSYSALCWKTNGT